MRKLIFTGLSALMCVSLSAQNKRDIIKGDTGILLIKTRVELSDARRIPTEPKIETPEHQHPELNYNVRVQPQTVAPSIQVPDAQKMQKEKAARYHHNYIKVGMGNNVSPLADVYITMPGKSGLLAFSYHFMSANGPGYLDFNRHRGAITGKKYLKNSNLEAEFLFNRRGLHFYGYNPELYIPADAKDIQQTFQDLGGRLAWETKPMGRNKTYIHADADFYSFSDKWKQTENRLNVRGLYRFEIKKNELNIRAAYQMQNFANDSNKFIRNYIDINPYYSIRKKNWSLNVGFNSIIRIEENEETVFNFFPRVDGVYEVEKDQLSVFGGFDGNVNKNNFRDFANQNPFLSYYPNLTPSVTAFAMEAGIKGKITGNTGFVTKVHYSRTKDMPLFVNDTNILNTFVIINDDVELIRLNAELSHQYSEKFRMALTFNYNFYTSTIQEAAWQLPALETKLNLTYNMADKILLSFDAFVFGSRKSYRIMDPVDQFNTIKPLGDFNVGIDYRWKKQLSAFLRLNNLLGQHFQVWYSHPMYSFNGHIGLALGF
ncbi:MAG: TonB-dependent receptor [Bacteroidota bacterium]|nr:TonB-dependent receptor [Bacteroidota bacterium]MDX5431774.1 TonB-dependent receptor [Bacteroidota bacterium]MDX5470487.1 TonB-dependent receptor [Bacteroidota bacterium]